LAESKQGHPLAHQKYPKRQNMNSFIEYKQTWRLAGMLLLLFALAGPWTHEVIHVPAEHSCNAPYVRLEGDFCGQPVLGLQIVFWLVFGFISNLAGLLTGAVSLAGREREFLFMLLPVLVVLPLLITPFAIWKGDSERSNAFLLAAWGLATIPGVLWFVISLSTTLHPALWGAWVYIALTPIVLILELLALIVARKEKQSYEK
jgi:hypothetical protein